MAEKNAKTSQKGYLSMPKMIRDVKTHLDAGRLRLEGSGYVVKEDDVLHFRFNV